jgi:hypothetical protein
LGLLIFAEDHANAFPSTISATNSGAMEPMLIGDVVPCFNAITNYTLKKSIFRCLTDKQRCDGSPEGLLARTNLSYFVSLDASETNSPTYTILTGDRHLTANTKPIGPGLFSLNTNQTVEWSAELHSQNKMPAGGVFSFADGHAEWVSVKSLSQVVARQNMATNRLAVP